MDGFELKIDIDDAAWARLMNIPELLRLGPLDRVLGAMATPILAKAKAIAPDATRPGKGNDPRSNRQKYGKNVTKEFAGAAAMSVDTSKENLGKKTVRYDNGAVVIVGGKAPNANKLNFDASKTDGRDVVYWGKPQGRVKYVPPSERFMQRAMDETLGEQKAYGINQLQTELKRLNLG